VGKKKDRKNHWARGGQRKRSRHFPSEEEGRTRGEIGVDYAYGRELKRGSSSGKDRQKKKLGKNPVKKNWEGKAMGEGVKGKKMG